jgi:hypothetical protein
VVYYDYTTRASSGKVSIVNTVHDQNYEINGEFFAYEGIDPLDVFVDALQRGER